MTGSDVSKFINDLRNARRNEVLRRMEHYDEFMHKEIERYRTLCPHDVTRPTDNGLGWIGTECVWCGKQLTNEYKE